MRDYTGMHSQQNIKFSDFCYHRLAYRQVVATLRFRIPFVKYMTSRHWTVAFASFKEHNIFIFQTVRIQASRFLKIKLLCCLEISENVTQVASPCRRMTKPSLIDICFCNESVCLIDNHNNIKLSLLNPYPTAFPYGNGMVLHFYQQQESSTTKTVHKIINKRLKTYV